MKANKIALVVLMSMILTFSGCTNTGADIAEVNNSQVEQLNDTMELRQETEHFQFYSVESDVECLEALADTIEESYSRITTDLETDLDSKLKVNVYKNIDEFHKAIGQTGAPHWVVGSAYGDGIQMVSPLNPGGVHNYDTLIKVVVHEFTHFVIKNITPSETAVPLWLNEGVATYEAKQTELLDEMGKWVKHNNIPALDTLGSQSSFEGMADNKLYPFSYTLVEFIINEYGIEKLNAFIRSPSDYSGAFGVDKKEFEQAWKDFLKEKYESQG